jgi:glycosyltransferase involved in cell wall biosynthesis
VSTPLLDELRERFPRVAVVHEWLTVPGGSEQVVLELLEMFPTAELFTCIYDPAPWPAQITQRPVHVSYLNRIPGAVRNYQKLLPLMDRAYRSFDLEGFDLILSSNHACAKNVRTPPGALHVCYCHTPMRYAWEEDFLEGEEIGRLTRLALPPLLGRLRRQDLRGSASPHAFVANSQHVAQRIERYYGRTAEVVHPPVDVERYLALERAAEDYYLVFGRVVPYKRVDLAVDACARLGVALKVAGDGRALEAVRAGAPAGSTLMGAPAAACAGDSLAASTGSTASPAGSTGSTASPAGSTGSTASPAGSTGSTASPAGSAPGASAAQPAIEFLGRVDEDERDRLLRGARALLFPGEEDFGIVPVEAQAAGVPVIAYGVGGAEETVLDGSTGVLFDEQTPAALARAIERFQGLRLQESEVRANAAHFGRERFRTEMAAAIARAAGRRCAQRDAATAPGPPGAVAAPAFTRPAP